MKKRILVVEYDAQTVELIRENFPPSTFDLTVVDEGQKARDVLAKNPFDLVITAAMLPKFHGFNLSQYIHEQYPETRIIIISGIYKEMEYKRQAMTQYNADDFFQKPFDGKILRQRALELLGMEDQAESSPGAAATMEFPAADTSKIPSISKQPDDESNRFSSNDLFGDIIEKVESEDAFEIELSHQDSPPQTPPAAETNKKDQDLAEEDVLDLTDADMVLPAQETMKMPVQPPQPPSFKAITSDDIDASLNNLLTQKTAKAPDTRRFKKIEDDFSKKFEDTLSGLGLDKKRKKPVTAEPDRPKAAMPRSGQAASPSPSPSPPPDLRTQEMPRPVETPPTVKASSSELGDYDILGLIARGGMAEIYKAKKKGVKGFEKVLAIKKILSGYGQDDKYIEMFVDEAKIAAELTHPNIVQIYDLGKKDDYYFIAMEYVQGKDLRVILKRNTGRKSQFPEELSVYLIIKVLEALSYAHSAKDSRGHNLDIVHRDISPPNIMISYGGEIKLTDFGVSKATIKVHQTLSGALKGKLLYMSPEQARAERDIDHRSDLYSVGIILFELLTGQKLFLEHSEMKVLKRVQQGQITIPSETGIPLDPELERILLKSLKLDREERYQSASEMMSDLESYLLSRYDHIPGYLHLAHFMNELFQEDMSRDGVKLSLKPLPYRIQRLPDKPSEPPAIEKEEDIDLQVEPTLPEEPPLELPDEESAPTQEPKIEFLPLDEMDEVSDQPPLVQEVPTAEEKDVPSEQLEIDEIDQIPPIPEIPEKDQVAHEPAADEFDRVPPAPEEPEHKEIPPAPEPFEQDQPPKPPGAGESPAESRPTFEIKLDEDASGKPLQQESIHIDDELAALDRRSGKRSRTFLFVILALAAVAAGVVWFMMNRTGEPPTTLTPPASAVSRQESKTPEVADQQALPGTVEEGAAETDPESGAPQDQQDAASSQTPAATDSDTTQAKAQPQTGPQIVQKESAVTSRAATREPKPESRDSQVKTVTPKTKPITKKATPPVTPRTETTQPPKAKPLQQKPEAQTDKSEETPPPAETKTQEAEDTTASQPATEEIPEKTPPVKPPPPKEVVKEGQLVTSVDSMPVAVATPYPKLNNRTLRRLKKTTTVVISFLVNHLGKIERIKFIRRSGVPDIDMQIARVVSNWTYRPAIKQGKKVKLWQTKSITIKK